MTEESDVLGQIKEEIEEIKEICDEVPGGYEAGKAIMFESLEWLDSNPGRTLKMMQRARGSIEAESAINRRYNALKQKRTAIPLYHLEESDTLSERLLLHMLKEGEFGKAESVLRDMEEEIQQDLLENMDSSLALNLPDSEIPLGRGSTLEVDAINQSGFPLRIISMNGTSRNAQVIVFQEYKGVMLPGSTRKIHINVIPGAEGDVVVELEALIEVHSKRVAVKRHASLKVIRHVVHDAPVETGPVTKLPSKNGPAMAPPSPVSANVWNPMMLIDKGTVDQWVECIGLMFENKGEVNLENVARVYPEFQKLDGCINLFQAMLVVDYRPTPQWSDWLDTRGFVGNELVTRCSHLIFDLRTDAGMRSELELDGSVGSSNSDHLIGALNIASGNILLPRDKLRGIKSWDIRGKFRGKDFTLHAERSVIKGSDGAKSRAVFTLQIV